MQITDMSLFLVTLRSRREHRWANLKQTVGSYVLCRITSDDGVSGWGEATALGSWGGDFDRYYGETPDSVWYVLTKLIAPAVLGQDFSDRHEILTRSRGAVRGHPYAKTAFECAVLDLVGRTKGVPVYELLGGRTRDRVSLAHSIGLMPVDAAAREAVEVVEGGIRSIKLKVGEDPERDVTLVAQVRKAVGPEINLFVDANQGWQTARRALPVVQRIAEHGVRYVEQPVQGLREMEALAQRVSVPIMADESMWTARDMADIALGGSVKLASIYTCKAGGLHGAMVADAVATAFDIGTNVNGSGETGVGNLANLHLAASMRSLSEACVIPISQRTDDITSEVAGRMYTDDVLTRSMTAENGDLLVPDGPGWGMEVDMAKIDELAIRSEDVSA